MSSLCSTQTDTERLRKFFDTIESNYRGLEALGVNNEIYSEIVVPTVLNKLPEVVRLTITCNKEHLTWNIKVLWMPCKLKLNYVSAMP